MIIIIIVTTQQQLIFDQPSTTGHQKRFENF